MSVSDKHEKWQNHSGCLNIEQDLDESDIAKLLSVTDIHTIQFYRFKSPSVSTLEHLNHFFEQRPEIDCQFMWYSETDWTFLKHLPSVKRLSLKSYPTKEFSLITEFLDLQELHIGETKSQAVDISFIEKLKNLDTLSIDGMKKGLNVIEKLPNLWSLNLRGVKLDNLDFITPLHKLRLFKLMYGSVKHPDALANMKQLEYLGISRTRQIPDFGFISTMTGLQFLHLEGLSELRALPDFSGLEQLQKLQIDNLKRLQDVASIAQLVNLKELLVRFPADIKASARNQLLEQLANITRELDQLEMTSLLDWNKNNLFAHLKNRGVKEFSYENTRFTQNSEGGWAL